jgi:endoglycosylceramidase
VVRRRPGLAVSLFLVAILGWSGCHDAPAKDPSCTGPDFDGAPLGVRCNQLVDPSGRTVLLHGFNAEARGLRDNDLGSGLMSDIAIPAFTADDPVQMRALGYNAMRLPINWSALEPTETGGFDEAMFDLVAATVDQCRQARVWVLLDIHQDGYSKFIGTDGAPDWAIYPPHPMKDFSDPNPNVSEPAQSAFATFFGDSGEHGAYLRMRFAALLARLAARFADDDAVIGFELYNEPIATDDELVAFDRQMIAAIRPVAPKKLIFFEPSAERNALDYANLGSGSLGAGTVYSPHVYTDVFTHPSGPLDKQQLTPSNQNARDEADSYNAPLVITEWGFGQTDPDFVHYARWQQELQEANRASSFFWVWKNYTTPGSGWSMFDIDPTDDVAHPRADAIAAMARVRLEAAAGTLQAVSYDVDQRVFQATFVGTRGIDAPNIIAIGATPNFATYDAYCDDKPVAHDAADPVSIPCSGPGTHTVRLVGR